MKKFFTFISILFLITACGTEKKHSSTDDGKKEIYASVISEGFFNCFSDSLIYGENERFTCEPSTVIYNNGQLFFGNDKTFPKKLSSIFIIPFDTSLLCTKKIFFADSLFKKLHKYEASTQILNGKYLIFSSAFSYHETHPEQGQYHNRAIYFDPATQKGGILTIKNSDPTNSFALKQKFREALKNDSFPQGPHFLKIEGLAAIPDNSLLFGVREFGEEYNNAEYTITFLKANYIVEDNKIFIDSSITKIYELKIPDSLNLKKPLGLSAIEYNPADSNIYFSTSYEDEENTAGIDAYVWFLSKKELENQQLPHLLMNINNKPITFGHKIEGFTFIEKNKIFFIADDDRIDGTNEDNPKFRRKLNQSYWCIVELNEKL